MKNLKDFTNAEFLSFLYSEKSREIENNAVPGWNKWVIIGTIITIFIYLYNELIKNINIYNYQIISEYYITLNTFFLFSLFWISSKSNKKTYILGKVRTLKEEAPILSYAFQFVLCLICSVLQFYYNGNSYIFWNLALATITNTAIILYIIINHNKYVLAELKKKVFSKSITDYIIHIFSIWPYLNIIFYSIFSIIKSEEFHSLEFEFSICLTTLISLFYLIINIKHNNKHIPEALDNLINKFVIGSISKEEAYNKYILIIYGLSAYQAIEKDLEIINNIKNNYDNKIDIINDIKKRIESNSISTTDIKTLQDELAYYKKANSSLSKLLNKITEITKLGIPAIADEKFKDVIKEYEKTSKLLSNLIKQTLSVSKEIDNQVCCKKFGGLCLNKECSNRNDRMLLKHKIQIRIQYIFRHTKQICINKKNHDI